MKTCILAIPVVFGAVPKIQNLRPARDFADETVENAVNKDEIVEASSFVTLANGDSEENHYKGSVSDLGDLRRGSEAHMEEIIDKFDEATAKFHELQVPD
eukprot:gene1163-465_t